MYKVYGGEGCGSCKAATMELDSKNLEYEYFDVYTDMVALEFITSKGLRGIPQIFTDAGEHVGGYQDLLKHLNS